MNPRTDTLLNELRNLLLNYTPQERVMMFEMITEGYSTIWLFGVATRLIDHQNFRGIRDAMGWDTAVGMLRTALPLRSAT